MLGAMFSGRHTLKKTAADEYFIDRNGTIFQNILSFLRNPNYKIGLTGTALEELKEEALYFGLNDAMFPIPPPFVPEAPFDLMEDTYGEYTCNITQTADGIYYGEYSLGKSIMTICTGCNKGFVGYGSYIDCYKFANFAVGRDFVPGQPQRSVCTDKC